MARNDGPNCGWLRLSWRVVTTALYLPCIYGEAPVVRGLFMCIDPGWDDQALLGLELSNQVVNSEGMPSCTVRESFHQTSKLLTEGQAMMKESAQPACETAYCSFARYF